MIKGREVGQYRVANDHKVKTTEAARPNRQVWQKGVLLGYEIGYVPKRGAEPARHCK